MSTNTKANGYSEERNNSTSEKSVFSKLFDQLPKSLKGGKTKKTTNTKKTTKKPSKKSSIK